MRGASSDKKCQCKERTELGLKMPVNGTTYYSFKFKTPGELRTKDENGDHVRTMIAQLKPEPNVGSQFLGCKDHPKCRFTCDLPPVESGTRNGSGFGGFIIKIILVFCGIAAIYLSFGQ